MRQLFAVAVLASVPFALAAREAASGRDAHPLTAYLPADSAEAVRAFAVDAERDADRGEARRTEAARALYAGAIAQPGALFDGGAAAVRAFELRHGFAIIVGTDAPLRAIRIEPRRYPQAAWCRALLDGPARAWGAGELRDGGRTHVWRSGTAVASFTSEPATPDRPMQCRLAFGAAL